MKRIKKARIDFISLVPKGKNKTPILYKEDGTVEWETIIRKSPEFEDNGELTAVVYLSEYPDTDEHVASKEVVKDMAYNFQKEGGQIDIRHDGKPVNKDRAYVAENFIIQKGDPRFSNLRNYDGENIDAADSWGVVIKLEDPELRKLYRDDGWQGVSMAGPALLVDEAKEDTSKEEYSMKPEELEQVMEKSNTSLLSGLTNLVKEIFTFSKKEEPPKKEDPPAPPEKKPEEKEENPAPAFDGDPTKAEDVQKHEQALLKWKLEKEVDWSDPDSVRKHRETLKKADPKSKEEEKEEDPELVSARKEKEELEARIAKMEKASTQPMSKGDETHGEKFFVEGLTKEDQDLIELGRRMGRWANGEPLTGSKD